MVEQNAYAALESFQNEAALFRHFVLTSMLRSAESWAVNVDHNPTAA
jgi:hypothetical protein